MEDPDNVFGIRGFLIDAPEFGTLRGRKNGALIVENDRIAEVGDYDDLRSVSGPCPFAGSTGERWRFSPA